MKQILKEESGFALISTLLVIVVLSLLASVSMMTTSKEMEVNSAYRGSQEAFYSADAGNQAGLSWLKENHSISSHPLNDTAAPNAPAVAFPALSGVYGYGSSNLATGSSSYTYRVVFMDPAGAPAGYLSRQRVQETAGFSSRQTSGYAASTRVYKYYYQVDSRGEGPQNKVKNIEIVASYLSEN